MWHDARLSNPNTDLGSRGLGDSNNILYPKEDKTEKVLLYSCRNCEHAERAPNSCVYRNEVHHSES
jgi:DNA-directed RNA polymerase subunit M/transcription elongation factor TFIIS